MDLAAFLDDLKTRNATERRLERIGEAAKKLGESQAARRAARVDPIVVLREE